MSTPPQIVPAQDDLKKVVQSGYMTYEQLLEKLAKPAEQAQQETRAEPTSVTLADSDRKALRTFAATVTDLQLPSGKRELAVEERQALLPVFEQAKDVRSAAQRVEDAIKEAFHNHIDLTTSDAPRNKHGHKFTEGEVSAPGYPNKAVRGVNGGKSVELTNEDLLALEAEELITHAEYLAATKSVPAPRVVVPDALMRVIQKRPELVDVLAGRVRRSPQTLAIRMAKN